MKIKLAFGLLILLAAPLCAQTPRDFAIDLSASVSTNVPRISLSWTIRRSGNIKYQKIHRRLKGETSWNLLSDLTTAQTSYADTTADAGVEYEYWMERYYTNIYPNTAQGYLSSGVSVPMADARGKLLLVVDNTMAAPLAPEIEQLKADLTGDGWDVQTITAYRTNTAQNVRAQILSAYNADPANVKMVYLLGHVPVPYSGNIAPDGHGNHYGAWPADGYYGDMNGTWTDTSVNNTSASDSRNWNIPGDGKFDQSNLPSPVELMVGRVDLHSMTRAPSTATAEASLLRRYLRKAHDFRYKRGAYADIPRRSVLRDGFGYFGGENFALAGWSWMFTGAGLTVDEPGSMQLFLPAYAGGKKYLIGYGNGGGSWETASSVGNSSDFGRRTYGAAFTSLFGSYFGDWDCANAFMRSVLAGNATEDSLGLTCFWGGRPNRVNHQMGLGETAGYCMMVSHNSSMTGGGGYTPNIYNGVHCGLLGDPALRLHAVEPPRNVTASSSGGAVSLAWSASTETNLLGYLVYRSATADGPFTRLTAAPLASPAYADGTVTPGQSYAYLVRTLKMESAPGGTYENPSVGVRVTVAASASATPAPRNPGGLTAQQGSSTNAALAWADSADNEAGFRIERKTNPSGSYVTLAAVAANTTSFTDPGPFSDGSAYYYRVVATNAAGESPPSPEASFEAEAGYFDLEATKLKVSKATGFGAVRVNRFGGRTGEVSVRFATSDYSALAGMHYTATNFVMTWADGDTNTKTVNIPLLATALPQPGRQFTATLSSPSAGTGLGVYSTAAVLIEDPAGAAAPWSQTTLGSLTDFSSAVLSGGILGSTTMGGSGVIAGQPSENGRFLYQSRSGDGLLTAYIPAPSPGDGNARYALMARASTTYNVAMFSAATSGNTSFGSKMTARTVTNTGASEQPASGATSFRVPCWLRLYRAGNVFGAEASADGTSWTMLGVSSQTNLPSSMLWGFFSYSSDWAISTTYLGNYHLAFAQNMALTNLPPPAVPTRLTATLASSSSAALQWDAASFASGYRIERQTEGGGFVEIGSMPSALSTNQTYLNLGLEMNTAYAYRVVATNAAGASAPSAVAYLATPNDELRLLTTDGSGSADAAVRRDMPGVPLGLQTNLTVAGYDASKYTLLPNAAKSYLRFNLGSIGTFATAQLRLVALPQTNSAPVRAGSFYFYVSLLDESSDAWDESTITWDNAPQNNTGGYDFSGTEYSVGGIWNSTAPEAGTTVAFDLDAATLNSYRGANGLVTLGLSQYYETTEWASREHPTYAPPTLELIIPTNVPPRASFLAASPGLGWSVDLRWQDNSANETGFTLERREGEGDFATLQTFGPNTNAFTDASTQPGVTYTYRLRSFNANGPADWTPEVTITAATLDTARSTVWDGGGADTLFTTATNWDFNTRPAIDGSEVLTFGTAGSTVTVNTNAFLRGLLLNRDANLTFAAGGGALALGDAGLRTALPTATSRAFTFATDLVLASNQTWCVTNNGAGIATVTVAGRLSGAADCGITKAGNGVLALSASNTFDGATAVYNGQLALSHPWGLGSTNGPTSVRSTSGGYIQLSGNITVPEPLTLNGERPGYQASLLSASGSNIWSGPITRVSQTRLGASGGATLVIAGGMTGSGGSCVVNAGGTIAFYKTPLSIGTDQFYTDSGGLTIIGVASNTWGDTLVAGGTLRMEVTNGLPPSTILKIGISYSTGGTFDLNGFDQTVGQLRNETALAGTRVVTSAPPAVLTVNQSVNSGYDGRLAGALSLIKSGSGTLILSNALNTLSGSVTVQGGTLTVAPPSSLGASTNIVVSSGTLELQTQSGLADAATLSIADGAKVSVAAGLTETVQTLVLGGVRKGAGTWGATGSGADYTDDSHFAGSGRVYVSSGFSTVWDGGGADTMLRTGGNWDFDSRPAMNGTAYVTFGTGGSAATVNTNAAFLGLALTRDADFTLAAGGGTLTLGNGGIWAQAPNATSRTYAVAAPVALAADQSWGVTNTGAGTTTLVVSGPVTDGAAAFGLTKSGNGLLTLAGDSSYDGPTTLAAGGGLRVAHANALGSAAAGTDVPSNGWIEIGGSVAVPEPLTLRDAALAGALRSADGTNVWSGPITLAAPARLRALAGSRLTLSGGASGSSDLLLSPDAGGELAVAGGALNLPSRKVSAVGEGTVTLAGAGHAFATLEVAGAGMRLRLGATNALPASAILSVGSAYSAMGVVDLNGFDQTVARLIRGTTSSSTNRLVTSASPAVLTVNETSASAIYFNGHLTGALGLTKGESGYLSLSGTSNTFTGATALNAGTLEVGASARLGFSPRVSVNGGTLRLLNTNALADTATLLIAASGKVYLVSGTETVGALYLDGQRQGEGTWGASGSPAQNIDDSHFSGTGVIRVRPGTPGTVWDGEGSDALFNNPSNWDTDWYPAFDGTASVRFGTGGSAALLNTNAFLAGIGFFRDADFALAAGGGTLTLGSGGIWAQAPNATSRTYSVAAPVALAADQQWGVTNTGAGTTALVVAGAVSDGAAAFGLTKSGNGLLTLAGDSSYDGATTVAAGGGLRVSHANGLGSTAGGTDVASNGWVEVAGSVAVPEPLTLRDAATSGALRSAAGTNVWSGPVSLAAPARVRASAGSRLTLAGGVTGASDLLLSPDAGAELAVSGGALSLPSRKVAALGEGTVTLASGGHAFGTLEVAGVGMRLRLGAPNALPASAILSVGGAYSAMGIVDLAGFDQTVARLVRGTTSANSNRIVTSAAPATLTVNETSASAIYFNGHLTGALGLTKGESGYLSLTGTNNTFTGATTVNAGTLEVGASARLGFSPLVRVNGGTLRLLNAGALADTATLRLSSSGKVYLQSGSDTVTALFLDGKWQRRGTYGSTSSGATYTSDAFFSSGGAGVLNVLSGPACIISLR